MPSMEVSLMVSATFLVAFLALVIVLALKFPPYEVRLSKRRFAFDVALSSFAGWVTVLTIVLWGLPHPTIDQIMPLPVIGMITGASAACHACVNHWGRKLGDRLRRNVQKHTKQT